MRFEKYSIGSIRIDGVTYEHDVVIDRGKVHKRKKKPSRKFQVPRLLWTQAPVHRGGNTLELPAARDRHGNRRLAGHGRGET